MTLLQKYTMQNKENYKKKIDKSTRTEDFNTTFSEINRASRLKKLVRK